MKEKEGLFKNIKTLNFDMICENFAHDWDMFQFSLRVFKDNYLDSHKKLEEVVNHGEVEEIHRLIHSLKGAFNQVGAYDMGEYFLKLEIKASEGDVSYIKDELDTIKDKIQDLIKEIEELSE
ncbi:MAG: Hpt domain-containing protein [Bacteriovoracaceae bacterium]